MRLSKNKTDLVRFLINDSSTNIIHAKILEDKELYVTVEDKAFCISSNGNKLSMVLCSMLSSEQEEADTKVCLCAQFAFDTGFERFNIVTVDTDILEMYFQSMLNGKIYLQYGTSSATLYETVWKFIRSKSCSSFAWFYMLLVVTTQLAVSKEKILWKSIIFSQEQGFARYFKFCQIKNVLTDKIHV